MRAGSSISMMAIASTRPPGWRAPGTDPDGPRSLAGRRPRYDPGAPILAARNGSALARQAGYADDRRSTAAGARATALDDHPVDRGDDRPFGTEPGLPWYASSATMTPLSGQRAAQELAALAPGCVKLLDHRARSVRRG
jgi:hypothetical protein